MLEQKIPCKHLAGVCAALEKNELEDLYLPYKPKRRTRATIAREKGLEPLATLLFGVEARDLVLEDQVGPHAVVGEVPDSLLVLGAVGVAVEVAHAVPARVLEQLDREEGAFLVLAGEA